MSNRFHEFVVTEIVSVASFMQDGLAIRLKGADPGDNLDMIFTGPQTARLLALWKQTVAEAGVTAAELDLLLNSALEPADRQPAMKPRELPAVPRPAARKASAARP